MVHARVRLDRSDPGSDGGDGTLFAARRDFARYMRHLLDETLETTPLPCAVRHRRARAVDIERTSGDGWRVVLADGAAVDAGVVVVCIGHSDPTPPPPFAQTTVIDTGRVLADPWDADALAAFGPDARILILGQGLTMGDVLSSLETQRHRGPVVAVSRRGLLARTYADSVKTPVPFETLSEDARASAVIRLMRQACDDAARTGHSWNSVIETTRERGGALWRRLSIREQCRLIRHARIFWDAHRYRMAPQVASAIDRARATGRLRLLAGRVIAAAPAPDEDAIDVSLRLRPRLGGGLLEERFDLIVSCIGPTHDVADLDNPFTRALLKRGLAEAHPTRLGFVVGGHNRLFCQGREIAGIHVVGPLSRGACGDIVGAPEISRQARMVVESLLQRAAVTRSTHGNGGTALSPAKA